MAFPHISVLSLLVLSSFMIASAGNFYQDFDITWGDGRAKILNNGDLLTLNLDKASGSGFQSRNEYLFGKIDMQLKLVPGNSAGTVTAYYQCSTLLSHSHAARSSSTLLSPVSGSLRLSTTRPRASRVSPSPLLLSCSPSKLLQVLPQCLSLSTDRSSHSHSQSLKVKRMKKFFPVLSRDKTASSSVNLEASETPSEGIKIVDYELLETDPGIRPPISSYHPDIQNEVIKDIQNELSSKGSNWDEIDFEFLGNLSGDPYILHTNVFSQGKGNREQQFYLWFDPTADFHTYSILWNPQRIVFSVDGTPIREFKNMESQGVPFPKDQPMRIYSSLWNADDWATRGGVVKTDWSKAPFTASYRNFNANACVRSTGSGTSSCTSNSASSNGWLSQELDSTSQDRLLWVQKNYMIYNYCSDTKRFPQGLPTECKTS